MTETCALPPFRYQATPVTGPEAGASGNQINEQNLEGYLARLKEAICADLGNINVEQSFLDLTDTPDTYAGAALQVVIVNAQETGLQFSAISIPTTFLSLTDTPNSYTGQALKGLRVNAGETAVEFFTRTFLSLTDVPASYSGQAGRVVAVNTGETGLEFGDVLISSLTQVQTSKFRHSLIPNSATTNSGSVVTNVPPSSSTLLSSFQRITITTGAGAGASAFSRATDAMWWLGDAAGRGGFTWWARFGTSTALAQQRAFIGMWDGTTPGNVQPDSLTNLFGFGYNSAETTWSEIHNDAAGTATKTSLGAGFPVDSSSVFNAEIAAGPNAGSISWRITNVGTGAVASGVWSANIPANTVIFRPIEWINNGTTPASATLCIINLIVSQA